MIQPQGVVPPSSLLAPYLFHGPVRLGLQRGCPVSVSKNGSGQGRIRKIWKECCYQWSKGKIASGEGVSYVLAAVLVQPGCPLHWVWGLWAGAPEYANVRGPGACGEQPQRSTEPAGYRHSEPAVSPMGLGCPSASIFIFLWALHSLDTWAKRELHSIMYVPSCAPWDFINAY